ncbi:carboxymuconolactone decarboxylase family protein [Bartonella sp. HY329]|uniref:carboxymuconolactone decarboxylase family protein n=1 Tax=unclassified Bartonella TaxID=2645622 RepID=UPI0021C8668D|nr:MULTISPECIES: carboxymuconolactone decarboxylase family protein [unclassified Bartonella]UXM95096.1 carboxymuconolactone decarboxylase family protein [Bartonella sp. HY329]UXN09419.1 carboxymuconolactone decarboxylase family protein [Bartonella sp. HY328]
MLSQLQQMIVPIAAFTAKGDIAALKTALDEALDNGVTINEAKEVIIQTYAYAGFPRSLNGLNALQDVLAVRKSAGKNDELGRDISPIAPYQSTLEIGTKIQTEVVGQPVAGGVYDFAPAIDQFLKSHLFGDIFARDILDYPTREVATIAILATIPGLEAQLQGHYNIGMNTGLSKEQLHQIVNILNANVGSDEGERAQTVLIKVLA